MNTWISTPTDPSSSPWPTYTTPNQDMAIRMFCTARHGLQEEPTMDSAAETWEEDPFFTMEAWPTSFSETTTPSPTTTEEDFGIVDGFMNADDMATEEAGVAMELHPSPPPPAFSMDHPSLTEPGNVDKGLELVHLLLACAEAVGCRDAVQAASALRRVWPLAHPSGDPLQRVSYRFAVGLRTRLALLHIVGAAHGSLDKAAAAAAASATREERMEAFQLLHQNTPYTAFGFMAANEAICQAAQGKDSLHVVDLGMVHCLQWPSLVRMLASRPGGPPAVLRITGVGIGEDDPAELHASMGTLIVEAASLGVKVEFRPIKEAPTPEVLVAGKLGVVPGEVLFVNSFMHLHKHVKESRGSLKAVLTAVRRLCPTLLTVVEQDANHNGPFFLARFVEALHYYASVFDSLEAGLPRGSKQRARIERGHFGEEILNVVAYEGGWRVERHERADQWRRQLGRAGFQAAAMGGSMVSQARMLVSVYGCEGYTVGSEKGCLLLGWRGRPIILASAWRLPAAAAASS